VPRGDSSILQHNSFQRIPHILARVDRFFDHVEELFPLHHFQRLAVTGLIQLADGGVVVVVADALEMMNVDQLLVQLRKLSRLPQLQHRIAHGLG
jgi:hypothetical protein